MNAAIKIVHVMKYEASDLIIVIIGRGGSLI